MKTKSILFSLLLLVAIFVGFLELKKSIAQEPKQEQVPRDKRAALSSLPLIGSLRLGMNVDEVNAELLKFGVAPLKLRKGERSEHNVNVPNTDLSDIGVDFTQGKLTYFGRHGKLAPTSQKKLKLCSRAYINFAVLPQEFTLINGAIQVLFLIGKLMLNHYMFLLILSKNTLRCLYL